MKNKRIMKSRKQLPAKKLPTVTALQEHTVFEDFKGLLSFALLSICPFARI